MLPNLNIFLLSNDVILRHLGEKQVHLKVFSWPLMLYYISKGGFSLNIWLALTINMDFASELAL